MIHYVRKPESISNIECDVNVESIDDFLKYEENVKDVWGLFEDYYNSKAKFLDVIRRAKYIFYIADDETDHIISFAIVSGAINYQIDYVTTHMAYRGHGYASDIVRRIIDYTWLHDPNVHYIALSSKQELKEFYTSLGFVPMNGIADI